MTRTPTYDFRREAAIAINSGMSNAIILSGNIHGLFFLEDGDGDYVPLVDFLTAKWNVPGQILVIYQPNGKIRILDDASGQSSREQLKDAWLKWKTGSSTTDLQIREMLSLRRVRDEAKALSSSFDSAMKQAENDPVGALQLLRQLCLCSRTTRDDGPLLKENLIVVIDEADMLFPEGEVSRLSLTDRRVVGLCQEWFSDPLFMNGRDAVILLSGSRSAINRRLTTLPQVRGFDVPAPDGTSRAHFIRWFNQRQPDGRKVQLWSSQQDLARLTGGLSIHALRQLLLVSCHTGRKVTAEDVIVHVQEYIRSQLGEDVVEFKCPAHTLKDVVGFKRLKQFLRSEFIPRLQSTGPDALAGAAVSGPIGSGKSFIFEAVAAEADMVVLVLKNLRSKWFGETDVIFETLRRVLDSLARVLIFVDEADTQFGGVGADAHPTERRLTGKIQAMMADPKLRGRVKWLLMTARIHLLSDDIRRPGRVGDLIMPVLDPEGEDRKAFIRWLVKPVVKDALSKSELAALYGLTEGYFAASFASLRAELIAKADRGKLSVQQIIDFASDHILPDIGQTRRLQTLYAMLNCTRLSLLPETVADADISVVREQWLAEIRQLESRGIR